MEKDTRNVIERATQRARELLEEDFGAQLEGDFDVHLDGSMAEKAGSHLSARRAFQRERIVAAIGHKRAAGLSAADAALDYLRDAAFTTLNRFVALKMLEARELVQECVTKGEQSAGYREFCGMAPGLPLLPESAGYRLYIESLFDELSTEVKVLFDRRDPASVLWPKRATFEQLLGILNASELAHVWGEDETIGWVYQFFNGQDERRKMREESQAPRNSRELAVRNQFFTPRYVVQFLTDNTLGRIWYEMRGTETVLADKCEYMVRKPGEEFAPRAKKDPRDLRVLDPACGSGHFLLYAFDLLLAMYEEAYADAENPKSEATGKALSEDYPSLDALRKAMPGLVLAHNLHGVDIDPRCAQIAQLALWMRAQKAYRDFGTGRNDRPPIRRSNIVVAEPLVADDQIAKEFVAKLGDVELGRVFTSLVESLSLAGDLGLLLRIEQLVARHAKRGQTADLFEPPEDRIRAALNRFVREEAGATNTSRRLFVDDAEQGVALLGVAEKRFDAVLMNPPFGQFTSRGYAYAEREYSGAHTDIFGAFMRRGLGMLEPHGALGCITSRSFIMRPRMEELRRVDVIPSLALLLDLGAGVMDAALVDAAAVTLRAAAGDTFLARDLRATDRVASLNRQTFDDWRECRKSALLSLPKSQVLYSLPPAVAELLRDGRAFEPNIGTAREGMKSFDNERFLRLAWEVESSKIGPGREWLRFAKGGPFSFLWGATEWLLNWKNDGAELQEINRQLNGSTAQVRQASTYWFRPGATYTYRSSRGFSARVLPSNFVFSNSGPAVLLNSAVSASRADHEFLLGWLNSRLIRAMASMQANAGKFLTGIFKKMPWVNPSSEQRNQIVEAVHTGLVACLQVDQHVETSPFFVGPAPSPSLDAASVQLRSSVDHQRAAVDECIRRCSQVVDEIYGVESAPWADDVLAGESDGDEQSSTLLAIDEQDVAHGYRAWAVGVVLGRWSAKVEPTAGSVASPFEALPSRPPAFSSEQSMGIAVDDPGHCADISKATHAVLREAFGDGFAEHYTLRQDAIRSWLRDTGPDGFWPRHLSTYSAKERQAPIYWQLATPSACYSVWLYLHALSKDTLFLVQNEYVAPKLAHEERRLESLATELRDGATAAERKQLAAQEGVVEELRAFLYEVKRVAPLWNPNLDDGVIINFAPLWRLVPQHKAWQRELKATWDALCGGKYNWAHLAMHLWPERVIPDCATDRSLAIAHGLDDVFWVEGNDGKWIARPKPTRNIDELVRERTSPAVKSALKSLLEAPVPGGKSSGRKGAARRNGAAAADGGAA